MAISKAQNGLALKPLSTTMVSHAEVTSNPLNGSLDRDEMELARFGKLQQLKVR